MRTQTHNHYGGLTEFCTDLGGQNAPIPVSVGVSGILKVVDSLTPADSGKFFDYKGEIVPW